MVPFRWRWVKALEKPHAWQLRVTSKLKTSMVSTFAQVNEVSAVSVGWDRYMWQQLPADSQQPIALVCSQESKKNLAVPFKRFKSRIIHCRTNLRPSQIYKDIKHLDAKSIGPRSPWLHPMCIFFQGSKCSTRFESVHALAYSTLNCRACAGHPIPPVGSFILSLSFEGVDCLLDL